MAAADKPVKDTAHHDNGNIRYRGSRLGGEMHGKWEFFRKDGTLMRSGTLERGKQIGTWRTFDRSGKVLKETSFER